MDLTRPVAFMIIYDGNPQVNDDSPERNSESPRGRVFKVQTIFKTSFIYTI